MTCARDRGKYIHSKTQQSVGLFCIQVMAKYNFFIHTVLHIECKILWSLLTTRQWKHLSASSQDSHPIQPLSTGLFIAQHIDCIDHRAWPSTENTFDQWPSTSYSSSVYIAATFFVIFWASPSVMDVILIKVSHTLNEDVILWRRQHCFLVFFSWVETWKVNLWSNK